MRILTLLWDDIWEIIFCATLTCLLVIIFCATAFADDNQVREISINVFKANSGLNSFTSLVLEHLKGTVEQSASYEEIRTMVPLSKSEFNHLLKKNDFFNWWDIGEPSYKVWKTVVLHDGADDEFIPKEDTVEYHIFLSDQYGRTRRLYLLTLEALPGFACDFQLGVSG